MWVEVCEPELDLTIVIPAEPERALEVFHHPVSHLPQKATRPCLRTTPF